MLAVQRLTKHDTRLRRFRATRPPCWKSSRPRGARS